MRYRPLFEAAPSGWASPIVIAYHPRTNKPRFCVDYRALNACTLPDSYLMPLITDIMEAARGCTVFSSLDLVQGFGQLEVDSASRPFTAIRGPRGGNYQFKGSPFGLQNVPAAFQRVMDTILGAMTWICAAIYIERKFIFK